MKYQNDIEEEIDAIRDRLYSTIKDMTSGERVEYVNTRAREIMKKYGIAANNAPHPNNTSLQSSIPGTCYSANTLL